MGQKGRGMAEPPSPLTLSVTEAVRRLLDGPPSPDRLQAALRHLAKWRAALLDNTLTQRNGTTVLEGPFKGMAYPVRASEGARAARLLGLYEASLEPVIETIAARPYALVIDIGCAEGYYAVGLARRMPQARVLARDSSDQAQALCRALATANGVADRVQVGACGRTPISPCATPPPAWSSATSRAPRPSCWIPPPPPAWPAPTCWSRCMKACAPAFCLP